MKNKKKTIAIIIISLIVVGGAVFAGLYFFTDMFKSPQDLFYEYMGKAAKTETDYSYQDMLEELKIAQTKPYKQKTTLGLEVNVPTLSYTNSEAQTIADALNKLQLNMDAQSNPGTKQESANVTINYDGEEVTKLQVVKDDEKYGFKSELLDDKYIVIENKDLKSLFKKLGATSTSGIPDKIESLDLYDLLYVSKEDEQKIINTYKDVIKNSIPSENYTKTDNVTKNVNGKDVNTTCYSLKITEKDFLNIVIKFLETARDDETSLNIIVEKANKLMNTPLLKNYLNEVESSVSRKTTSYGMTNFADTLTNTQLTKSDLINAINNMLEDLRESARYITSTSAIEINVYEANGETARIELKTSGMIVMAMDFFNENGKDHMVMYTIGYNSTTYQPQLTKVLEIENKTTKNGDEIKSEGAYILYSQGMNVAKITFDVTKKGKVGVGKNEISCKIGVESAGNRIGLNINSEIEYTDYVDVESLTNSNSKILNDMSQKELNEYGNILSTNIEKNGSKLAQKLEGIFLKSVDKTESILNSTNTIAEPETILDDPAALIERYR